MGVVVELKKACRFEEFWDLYPAPRRNRRPACVAKWNDITNGGLITRTYCRDSNSYIEIQLQATPDEIIQGLKKNIEEWRDKQTYGWKDKGKFIPCATTWLNQGRWMDFI